MATRSRKSELRRRLPLAVSVALIVACLGGARARAQYESSGYQPLAGEAFFLMSDKTFGTRDLALVRLEVTGTQFGLGAVEAYGGVDVVLYRVPRPLSFLGRQKNLRRVSLEPSPGDEGLANTLAHLWDRWVIATRRAWRAIFSSFARREVVQQAPELATTSGFNRPTTFHQPPQFKPLTNFELMARFRYPIHRAAPIQPPKGVSLAGSSSDFISPSAGNVLIPLGRLEPGLYLVEAYIGSRRATTLVFASDTMAITKVSSRQMLVWTANRATGVPVRRASVTWTDGMGILQSGTTDPFGLVRFAHQTPERSYLFGQDPAGGVFISENFYYDSEIYDTKLYVTTDRPLYRPGDEVRVKVFGRDFESARVSRPVLPGEATLTAYDPGGAPVANQTVKIVPESGGDTSFHLPPNSSAGGYELRLTYRGTQYAAAFRVAEYQKPHFEITLVPDKADFKVGEPVSGRLQLHYPDGKPVKTADIQLTVRSQQLTTVDGELRFYGQFPVKLESEALSTDARGEASFTIPAAAEPSRFLLTALATDGAAYRVRTTRELLVERGQSSYSMRAEPQFSRPGDLVTFAIRPSGTPATKPSTWEWVRLEDRRRAQGAFTGTSTLAISFPEGGSYTVQLRDDHANVVAAAPHWVSGGTGRSPVGTIEIVPSKERYQPGEVAELLITFPVPVDEALLTLERDSVEQVTTLRRARLWVTADRIAPAQWRARVPIRESFAPNVTFSVAYVKDGEYVFQNQGLTVFQPTIDVQIDPNKTLYRPGEKVDVVVKTMVGRRPAAATVAVGVVDEMVFALQPEIAPDIYDFFFHARRNNVRTAASQNFISYDLASTRSKSAPLAHTVSERRVKVLERPRRDEVDTAFWSPALRTDASGTARFTFTMPDALTRWRITARALSADGTVGQRVAYVRSDKEFYTKWASPNWIREGDAPISALAVFNQTDTTQPVDVEVSGPGISTKTRVSLRPGVNYIDQPLTDVREAGTISALVRRDGVVVDRLETPLTTVPSAWPVEHTRFVRMDRTARGLDLPSDARRVRATFVSSAAAEFSRIADDLIEYPYGCIEQTASRMIPLALALESVPPTELRIRDRLTYQLNTQRLRVAYMASTNGVFGWWGGSTSEDPFLTAYAYYADRFATRALGIALPSDHFNRLLDVYRRGAASLPILQRALVVHFMQEMKLPVRTLAEGLLEDLRPSSARASIDARSRYPVADSVVMVDAAGPYAHSMALVLVDRIVSREKIAVPKELASAIESAYQTLRTTGDPVAEALMLANGRLPSTDAGRVLGSIRNDMATVDRALALAWVRASLPAPAPGQSVPSLAAPWIRRTTATGRTVWEWPAGVPAPKILEVSHGASPAVTAVVQFESADNTGQSLVVGLERRLYRVVKEKDAYDLQPVDEGSPLSTTELYLDEITVTPQKPVRFAVLEVPLPPGASVDSTTWGINLRASSDKLEGLERARHEPTRLGYVVPVDGVAGPTRFRHLIRFAERGSFVLPRARLYRMYQPTAKAFEPGSPTRRMDVR